MTAVSNPSKVMFPAVGLTKTDLVGYYSDVGAVMLEHIAGRPLTLERFPSGVGEQGFMQKNAGLHFPDFIDRIAMPKRGGETLHSAVSTVEGIEYLANQGTITFHVPTTLGSGTMPDRMIIDLDPIEGDVASARAATIAVKGLLEILEVPSRPMATGSKGYHVVVPLDGRGEIHVADAAARGIAELVAHGHPDLATTEFRFENRAGRVFVDWLRNRFGSTTVAPWSLRPRPNAPVAVCIGWDQLATSDPDAWTLPDSADLLARPDPWAGLWDDAVEVGALATKVQALMDESGVELAPFDRFRS